MKFIHPRPRSKEARAIWIFRLAGVRGLAGQKGGIYEPALNGVYQHVNISLLVLPSLVAKALQEGTIDHTEEHDCGRFGVYLPNGAGIHRLMQEGFESFQYGGGHL